MGREMMDIRDYAPHRHAPAFTRGFMAKAVMRLSFIGMTCIDGAAWAVGASIVLHII